MVWLWVSGALTPNSLLVPNNSQDCDVKFKSEFGCRIVNSIISWVLIFAQLTILGSTFVILSSAGNSIYLEHTWKSMGYVMVGFTTLLNSS
jgi:hypothetical protein